MPLRESLQKLTLAGPRLAYQQALAKLDTPPHAAECPIDAPWVAAIHYDGGDRSDYFTGVGVLIAPEWVLTCAHLFSPVFDRPETGEPPTADKTFHVRVGDPRLFTGTRHAIVDRIENNYRPIDPRSGEREKSRKNRRKLSADVTLLRLATPAEADPARLLAGPIAEGTAVSCLGWPGGPERSGTLTQVNTHIVTHLAGLSGAIKPDEFCVANADKPADMSNGCSGAPTVILPEPEHHPSPLVAGIISRGAPLGDDTTSDPAIVVDLTRHREFIETTTGITFLTAPDLEQRAVKEAG
ncbi:Trypsin [Amycolatopsis australiensis]|uniref:Trypsin n=2 Tax=Amycolatopsis australiensis TaxID=546364 RepID=A0A1K1RR78_9PSEU|nr:Trypsin [Amycolatopsis australiensis]